MPPPASAMAYPAREGKAVAEPRRSEGREWSRNRSQSYVLPCELVRSYERGGECQGYRLKELADYVQFSTNLHFAYPGRAALAALACPSCARMHKAETYATGEVVT